MAKEKLHLDDDIEITVQIAQPTAAQVEAIAARTAQHTMPNQRLNKQAPAAEAPVEEASAVAEMNAAAKTENDAPLEAEAENTKVIETAEAAIKKADQKPVADQSPQPEKPAVVETAEVRHMGRPRVNSPDAVKLTIRMPPEVDEAIHDTVYAIKKYGGLEKRVLATANQVVVERLQCCFEAERDLGSLDLVREMIELGKLIVSTPDRNIAAQAVRALHDRLHKSEIAA